MEADGSGESQAGIMLGREGGLGRHRHHRDGSKHWCFLLGDMGMEDRDACCCNF